MNGETIAALATATGPAALAIVRLSGPEAIPLVDRLFVPPGRIARLAGRTCAVGYLRDGDETIDQVVVTLFRAPHSYTGEDLVEITCHGGEQVPRRVLDLLLREGGARPARPGEFTLRAFLHGRLDLTQAEAVEALIVARSAAAASAAVRILRGDLSAVLRECFDRLTETLARVEATLDVLEDGAPDALSPLGPPGAEGLGDGAIVESLEAERQRLSRLLAGGRGGRLLADGLRVAIAGRPNAGKSSLFNALLARPRAIVSPDPGTTRDALEATVEWDGLPVTLIDTAGLRDATEGVEREGVLRAREVIESSSLVVHVIDAARTGPREALTDALSLGARQQILALHKWDLAAQPEWEELRERLRLPDGSSLEAIPSSVVAAPGTEALRRRVAACLREDAGERETLLLVGDRQRALLQEALAALVQGTELLRRGAGRELAACEVRRALDAVAELLGERAGPRVLEAIFARFCVGK